VLPPQSSGIKPIEESSCMTRSGFAPSLSICLREVNNNLTTISQAIIR